MKSILAFLLTIQTEDFQHSTLTKQLLAQLQLGADWQAVQAKLDDILTANPKQQATYNHLKDLLEKQNNIALPKIDVNRKVLTRSAAPGEPDKETTEITNFAVVILKAQNPSEKSKELLGDLHTELETKQRSE